MNSEPETGMLVPEAGTNIYCFVTIFQANDVCKMIGNHFIWIFWEIYERFNEIEI